MSDTASTRTTQHGLLTRIARLARRLLGPRDLHPGQVEELLDHARRGGMSNLLHLIHLAEVANGHRRSALEGMPVDAAGAPLPWFTYPAISFLNHLDLSERDIFEFGAGNGSLYFARQARSVVSVEGDVSWHAKVAALAPANLRVVLAQAEADYVAALAATGRRWDMIVIDGGWREACAQAALDGLQPDGWIILDNAERHPDISARLVSAGLTEVTFTGLGPVNYYAWTTAFYRR
jgi:hypothetical protein